ncbi:MAG TPA: hypothetical protein VK760_00580 [Candidatus Acidoferrales bacterium]|nr:hypothetical protein [Candidatus Acidoferrales bacterium]
MTLMEQLLELARETLAILNVTEPGLAAVPEPVQPFWMFAVGAIVKTPGPPVWVGSGKNETPKPFAVVLPLLVNVTLSVMVEKIVTGDDDDDITARTSTQPAQCGRRRPRPGRVFRSGKTVNACGGAVEEIAAGCAAAGRLGAAVFPAEHPVNATAMIAASRNALRERKGPNVTSFVLTLSP